MPIDYLFDQKKLANLIQYSEKIWWINQDPLQVHLYEQKKANLLILGIQKNSFVRVICWLKVPLTWQTGRRQEKKEYITTPSTFYYTTVPIVLRPNTIYFSDKIILFSKEKYSIVFATPAVKIKLNPELDNGLEIGTSKKMGVDF